MKITIEGENMTPDRSEQLSKFFTHIDRMLMEMHGRIQVDPNDCVSIELGETSINNVKYVLCMQYKQIKKQSKFKQFLNKIKLKKYE